MWKSKAKTRNGNIKVTVRSLVSPTTVTLPKRLISLACSVIDGVLTNGSLPTCPALHSCSICFHLGYVTGAPTIWGDVHMALSWRSVKRVFVLSFLMLAKINIDLKCAIVNGGCWNFVGGISIYKGGLLHSRVRFEIFVSTPLKRLVWASFPA